MRFIITVAVAAVALTGCGAADAAIDNAVQVVSPWEEDFRAVLDEEYGSMSNDEVADMCLALSLFGLDTPEQVGAVALAFDETGELPPAGTTVQEWADQEGGSVPFGLPNDLTIREVVNEGGAYILDLCGVNYQ